jgi:thermitase
MVDSGVNPTHPDLASKLLPGWNFLLNNSNTADDFGHGTATAGTAAAATNNGIGIAGVGWTTPIMPLVVLDSTDYASYSNIASAITYAADHGVPIINVSIGGSTPSSTLQSAVNYGWSKGAVVFASAMNFATSAPYYPAACDYVIAVSATEPGNTLASFSNYGSWIDLAAPGDNIYTTDNTGSYSTWYGTSFSSPIAAATGALALSTNPGLSAQSLVTLLEQNTDDIGVPGFDSSFGWGLVDAYKVAFAALSSLSSVDTTPPTVSISTPASGTIVSGTVQITGTATDNVGVTQVQLLVDGSLNSTCSSIAFSCLWNTSSVAAGSHTITVQATDAAGNSGSATETLMVTTVNPPPKSTTPPTVQIENPLTGATVSGNVAVRVAASDAAGVSQVSIYIDSVLKGTFTATPYTWSWNTKKYASGSHTVTATAWDTAANTATTSITVRK